MTDPRPAPPAELKALRSDLETSLKRIVADHGGRHPMALVIGNVLLRGDHKSLSAAWQFLRNKPVKPG